MSEAQAVIEAPLTMQMMRCDRQKTTLSVAGCTRMWRSAQEERPAPWESRHHCLACPIGAANAGQTPEEGARQRAAEAIRLICPRCQRLSSRLINGIFCIGDYNRSREVARGKNCKGNLPVVVMGRIHTLVIAVSVGDAPALPETAEAVMGAPEAVMLSTRRHIPSAPAPLRFGKTTAAWAMAA